MEVNYIALKDSVTVNYGGRTETITRGDDRFEKVLEAIREDCLHHIPEIVEIERRFDGDGVALIDGLLHVHGVPLPSELSTRILELKKERLPYASLLALWDNIQLNPSFNSRAMLFKFLEHNGHPLTDDGCFIAYRGVSTDFKDKHTGKFDNSVGSICTMDRSQVDENPNNTCSAGLHVACYSYAKSFGERTVTVKVNPKDVVAVPTDYNGTKMRVCKFEVVAECEGELSGQLYVGVCDTSDLVDDEQADIDCYYCGYTCSYDESYCPQCGEEMPENDCF